MVKMRKPGKRSMERNAEFCSNRDDDNDKYFFKVLVDDFRERLVIPDKFEQHFRGLIANSVRLESRYGYTFDVEVAKNLGKLVLQTGWKAFVTAHDLNMGDFLVFKNHIHGRERREEHIEISSSSEYLPMKSPGSKRKAWEQRKGSTIVKTSPSTSPPDTSGESISPEDQKSHYIPGYILPRGTCITCVQMKKLKDRVRASSSRIPIYGCIVKKSNVHGRFQFVEIPRVYAEVYLPSEDQTLMLQCGGKSWEVRCLTKQGNSGRKRLYQGWKQFACDNKLQLGDLCLFELLENIKYTMNVQIIRANEIWTSS